MVIKMMNVHKSKSVLQSQADRGHRGHGQPEQRRGQSPVQSRRRRIRRRRLSGQSRQRSGVGDSVLSRYQVASQDAGPGGHLRRRRAGAGSGPRMRRGRDTRPDHHLGRVQGDRAGGRALEEQIKLEAARFPGMRIIGPNCLGIIIPEFAPEYQFRRGDAAGRARGLHLAVGGAVHLGARLGDRGEDRILAFRLDRQHARCRFRRPDRLFRRGREDRIDHSLYRINRPGAKVHDGRAGVCPHQADPGLQGGTLSGIGAGGGLAHRRAGLRGRGLRRRLPDGPEWRECTTSARSSTAPS